MPRKGILAVCVGVLALIIGAGSAAAAGPDSSWTWCADESGTCSFAGTQQVVYGATGHWTTPRTFTSSVRCTNKVFGDPAPGTYKSCYRKPVLARPQVTSESIAPGSTISGTTAWTVTASGDLAAVEFWIDGVMVKVVGASPVTRNLDTTTLTNGTHAFGLVLVDSAGTRWTDYPDWSATVSNVVAAATSTSLSSSLNPSNANDAVVFTATVTSGGNAVQAGQVKFYDGGSSCSSPGPQVGTTQTVSTSGTATVSTSTLGVGAHTVFSCYQGTASFLASGTSLTQTINQPPPQFSPDRYVWCIGDPNWSYNQTLSGTSSPGWAYNYPTWNGANSSNGWARDSAGENSITPQRIYYDDSAFPNLMSGVSGSYGQLGEPAGASGPCKTVAVRIDANDPQTPGISNPSQGSVLRLTADQDQNPDYGTRPTSSPKQGQTYYYGFTAATNPGYVPHYDSAFGNWNSFGLEFHTSIGLLGSVMQEINTITYNGGTAGPNGAKVFTCGDTQNGSTRLITPRLQLALSAGLNDALGPNDANHTCLRVQGPDFHAGQVYKTIYQIHWDAFGQGTLKWYVDSGDGRGYVLYADLSGVSTLWRDSSGNADTGTYPQLLNYRKYDTALPDAIMYYGGFVRGSTMTDVQIP